MRRKDKKIGSAADLAELLRKGDICHLAMVDGGKPYVVPLNYGYVEQALYFHSAPEGRKIRILRKNPQVCFCVVADHQLIEGVKACSWSASYRSVIGTGKAHILTDPAEKDEGLKILMAQYSERDYELSHSDLERVAVIRVEIESLTGKGSG
ncbi:MAG: pyridoxamine 5'-phosphate oxidase family protein [bacterium]|nr:pyridoxamine 5'-phosphate oxidase family protein [bacterium]